MNNPTIDQYGNKRWYNDKKNINSETPKIEKVNYPALKEGYINGKLHRENRPACECSNETKYWYLDGKRIHYEIQKEFENIKKLLVLL